MAVAVNPSSSAARLLAGERELAKRCRYFDVPCGSAWDISSPTLGRYMSELTRKPTSRGSTAQAMESFRTSSRSEEHTSELQSLMRISYAVFCLKKKKTQNNNTQSYTTH